jgi:cyanophycinase
MKSKMHPLFLCLFFGFTYTLYAQETVEKVYTTGPGKGTLVVVGGGKLDHVILQRFIELAGGPEAAIVVIPTAGGKNKYDNNDGGAGQLRKYGATNVTVLHTNEKAIANTDEFIKPLLEAKAVWFSGGRQWRLVDAYKDTKTEKLLWEVLNRGGVIGGTSAGATIQGSYLARGDTKNNQIMMGDHEAGFGFIKNVAIDQHLLARNRQFDMFNILEKQPELLGIGLDESTAIIVTGDNFEVIGKSYIVVFDGSFWSREGSKLKNLPTANNLFYFLRPGDKYNMKERKVIIR